MAGKGKYRLSMLAAGTVKHTGLEVMVVCRDNIHPAQLGAERSE